MASVLELQPGEARTLKVQPGMRYLIHRPGRHPIYLVYAEDQRRQSVEAVGTFSNWAAALGAVRARHIAVAAAV
ncbi:MAG: hypothetical protein HY690_19190 [Chloroflexi bacterium]|nr:hypothetical protein [Chloroflexota bacterium]